MCFLAFCEELNFCLASYRNIFVWNILDPIESSVLVSPSHKNLNNSLKDYFTQLTHLGAVFISSLHFGYFFFRKTVLIKLVPKFWRNTLQFASGPSLVASGHESCLGTIKFASGPLQVASRPLELPIDHQSCLRTTISFLQMIYRKKNSRRRQCCASSILLSALESPT